MKILIMLLLTVTNCINYCQSIFDFEKENIRIEEYIYKITPQEELQIIIHFPSDCKKTDNRPAIVFFFGGGWLRGKINQFEPHANYFASKGLVTARADYRVKDRHGTTIVESLEDAKTAIRWLRINYKKLGIDTNRIVASGGSAGAHLAASSFIIEGFENKNENLNISSKPNLLVLFNPVLDVTLFRQEERIMSLDLEKSLSPNQNLSSYIPPTLLFYGTSDSLMVQGKQYFSVSKELGFQAKLYLAENVSHGFFNHEPWLSSTIKIVDYFLFENNYLYTQTKFIIPTEAHIQYYK